MKKRHSSIPIQAVAPCQFSALLVVALCLGSVMVAGQDRPAPVYETQAVILEGPYLVAPAEDSITVAWTTDTPCHSRVDYGLTLQLGQSAETVELGMLQVGTVHSIRLTGLQPGRVYYYRVSSTRVVKLKAYWPEKGQPVASPIHSFRTLDSRVGAVRFEVITDTQHEDIERLGKHLDAVGWSEIDFLVHTGDALDWVRDEEQLFQAFIRPLSMRLEHERPLVFVRGNHDVRGPFSRSLYLYLPTGTGEFYYAFDAGPVHFLVLDTGEDKPDSTGVYAGLNRFEVHRERELRWLEEHIRSSDRMRAAPFRVVLAHSPVFGWHEEGRDDWSRLLTSAGVDLVIAGHRHRLSKSDPGEEGRGFTLLVVGQDQVARVEASASVLQVGVKDTGGVLLTSFQIPSK